MTERTQRIVLPLLSTLFFLTVLLALRTTYEPAGNVTPVAPAASISEAMLERVTLVSEGE